MKYCRFCGKPIDDDSTFCTHCGKRQGVQDNNIHIEKNGGITSLIWDKIKRLKERLVLHKGDSNSFFKRNKKWIKRAIVILIVATIIGLLILLVFGFYQTSKWTREDECRETIAKKDISKADSIARVLFQEYADRTHQYDFVDGEWWECCNFSHVEKGIEIIRNAAEKGNADAQFTLGTIYAGLRLDSENPKYSKNFTMQDSKPDYERAAYWFNESASQGNPRATATLAQCYRLGLGVEKDLIKASKLCKEAAEKGDNFAQLNYGDMFRDGEVWFQTEPNSKSGEYILINAKPNIERAKEWWTKAMKNGNEEAKERLEKIY